MQNLFEDVPVEVANAMTIAVNTLTARLADHKTSMGEIISIVEGIPKLFKHELYPLFLSALDKNPLFDLQIISDATMKTELNKLVAELSKWKVPIHPRTLMTLAMEEVFGEKGWPYQDTVYRIQENDVSDYYGPRYMVYKFEFRGMAGFIGTHWEKSKKIPETTAQDLPIIKDILSKIKCYAVYAKNIDVDGLVASDDDIFIIDSLAEVVYKYTYDIHKVFALMQNVCAQCSDIDP